MRPTGFRGNDMNYEQQLKHPKWQRKRLEVFNERGFKCEHCGTEEIQLHVHHKEYKHNCKAWEYHNSNFLVLCDDCHEKEHIKNGDINNNYEIKENFRHISSYSDELVQLLEKRQNFIERGIDYTGLSTGLHSLDIKINGIESNFYVICSRPSLGKTALSLQIAYNIAKQGKSVLFFSYETPGVYLLERMISCYTNKNLKNFNSLDKSVVESLIELENINIYIDNSYPNANKLLEKCSKEYISKDVGLIIIDHLGLVPIPEFGKQWEKLMWLTRKIKLTQLKLDIPFLCVMQLNREIEKDNKGNEFRKPTMSDLRYAGSVEEDSDVIVSIYRDNNDLEYVEDDGRSGPIHFDIMKNRNGPVGEIDLYFDASTFCFRQLQFNDMFCDKKDDIDSIVPF